MLEIDTVENVFQFIEEYQNDEIIIIDYYAKWCKPCKGQSIVLKTVEEELKDKNIFFTKFDVEKDPDILKIVGFQSIPTVVVYKHGKEQCRFTGIVNFYTLNKTIKELKKLK